MIKSYINSRNINHFVIYSYILFICLHFYQISEKTILAIQFCIFISFSLYMTTSYINSRDINHYVIYICSILKIHLSIVFNYSYFQKKAIFLFENSCKFPKKTILASPFYFFIRTFMIFYDCIF